MIGRTLFCLLVGATLLVMPTALSGKAETARVTITGGGLASPIQITDAKVLELSHAWGRAFLDASRPPLARSWGRLCGVGHPGFVALPSRRQGNHRSGIFAPP